jgi:hypothetical protein
MSGRRAFALFRPETAANSLVFVAIIFVDAILNSYG